MLKNLVSMGNSYIGVSVLFLLGVAVSAIDLVFYDLELLVIFLRPLSFVAFYYIFKGIQLKRQPPEPDLVHSSRKSAGLHRKAKKILLSNLVAQPAILVAGIILMEMCGGDMGCFAGIFYAVGAMIIYLLVTIVWAGITHNKYTQGNAGSVSSLNPVAKGFFKVFKLITALYTGAVLVVVLKHLLL